MSSASIGTLRSGNSGRLFKASLVTAKRDDKFDLGDESDKPNEVVGTNKVCGLIEIVHQL